MDSRVVRMRVWGMGYEIWDMGYEICDMGNEIWGMRYGI